MDMIGEATGGQRRYMGKSVKDAHKGMGITEAEFNAFVDDLKKAMEKNNAKLNDVIEVVNIVEASHKDVVESNGPAGGIPLAPPPDPVIPGPKPPPLPPLPGK